MELKFVNFEQANALKELGFPQDEEIKYVIKDNAWSEYEKYDIGDLTCDRGFSVDEVVSAPTLELVAKWLRDEHKMIIVVGPQYTTTPEDNGFLYTKYFNNDYVWYIDKLETHVGICARADKTYGYYDDALSAGIDKAIEILKENK